MHALWNRVLGARNLFLSNVVKTRNFSCQKSLLRSKQKAQGMKQVEVDEPHVQQELGKIQMSFVKRAEAMNLDRANRHRRHRRFNWIVGGTCISLAIAIYFYTIFAIKQEKFLDDFEIPDPMEEKKRI